MPKQPVRERLVRRGNTCKTRVVGMAEEADVATHREPDAPEVLQLAAGGATAPRVIGTKALMGAATLPAAAVDVRNDPGADPVGQKSVDHEDRAIKGGEEVNSGAAWTQ